MTWKNSSHPELYKEFKEHPLCLSLCVFENELGDLWAFHEGVWRAAVVQRVNRAPPNTPFKDASALISGRDDIWLSYRRELCPQFSCEWWNIISSAYWESMWKWIVIAVLFETGPHVTSHSLQLRITEPCPYCLCLTYARNTAMHHHAPCMWYRGFVHTRQALSK